MSWTNIKPKKNNNSLRKTNITLSRDNSSSNYLEENKNSFIQKNNQDKLLLQRAVKNGSIKNICKILENNNDIITSLDRYKRNYLHLVFIYFTETGKNERNYTHTAKLLHKYGLDINSKDIYGNTPLHYAVGNVSTKLVAWLISKGVSNLPNNKDEYPSDLAKISLLKDNLSLPDKKTMLLRADGLIYLVEASNFFNYIPPINFHCPDRFSLETASMMVCLSQLIYKGFGCDFTDIEPCNTFVSSLCYRWGFSNVNISEYKSARGMVVKTLTNDNKKIFVIAFRGTKKDSIPDLLADLYCIKTGSGTHAGFDGHLKKIIGNLVSILPNPSKEPIIYITGHSLGGAMSVLMTDHLRKSGYNCNSLYMYTFGQPRVGDKDFQEQFDKNFKHAYIIQRHLDPVPLVPTISEFIIGGYKHCGSLRFLDEFGQLYNDTFYQYEDLKRGVLNNSKCLSKDINSMRLLWTEALNKLVMGSDNIETIEIHDSSTNDTSDTQNNNDDNILQKHIIAEESNIAINILKNRVKVGSYHAMENYKKDIINLQSKINKPFSWNNPEEAITSQLVSVLLTTDVYKDKIKIDRYKNEREYAYTQWIQYYTDVIGNKYTIKGDNYKITEWIKQEAIVLQQIRLVEKTILCNFPTIDTSFIIPDILHRKKMSPYVEISLYSIIYLISQVMKNDYDMGISFYKWLYWSLPDTGYSLSKHSDLESNNYILEKRDAKSPIRRGLQKCLINLSKHLHGIEELSHSLPIMVKSGNGSQIAELSRNMIQKTSKQTAITKLARVTLFKLQNMIVAQLLVNVFTQIKKIGITVAKNTVKGFIKGIKSGVSRNYGMGSKNPCKIIPKIIMGSIEGIKTAFTSIIDYFTGFKDNFIIFHNHLIACKDSSVKSNEKFMKFVKSNEFSSKLCILWINGLYTLLALNNISLIDINNEKKNNREYINKTLERFFSQLMRLIDQFTGLNYNNEFIKHCVSKLAIIIELLEQNHTIYQKVIHKLAVNLSLKNADLGFQIFNNNTQYKNDILQLQCEMSEYLSSDKQKFIFYNNDNINITNNNNNIITNHSSNNSSNIEEFNTFTGDINNIENIFIRNNDHQSLLHYVAQKTTDPLENIDKWIICANKLIQGGLTINNTDDYGNTPLHYAICPKSPKFIIWLLSNGALNEINKYGKTPETLAKESLELDNISLHNNSKSLLLRSDGFLYFLGQHDLINNFPTKNLSPKKRFSLTIAYSMVLFSKVSNLYRDYNNNNLLECLCNRWRFSSYICIQDTNVWIVILKKQSSLDIPGQYIISIASDLSDDILLLNRISFKKQIEEILDKISLLIVSRLGRCNKDNRIIYITGHSKGGSLGVLLMYKLYSIGYNPNNLYLYSFGQPKLGDKIFQEQYDKIFKYSYSIHRNLDIIPLLPKDDCNIYCGSIRYITETLQLYNDTHYQYEDMNRNLLSYKESILSQDIPQLHVLRYYWKNNLQHLDIIKIKNNNTNISSSIKKIDINKDNYNKLLFSNSIDSYINDLKILQSRIGKKFSWSDPENAITVQQENISLPYNIFSNSIKENRYIKEQNKAHKYWIKYYTQIPNYSFNLTNSLDECIEWIKQEKIVLQKIEYIENVILSEYPNLIRYYIPFELHRIYISPLVEIGFCSIIHLLSQLLDTNRPTAHRFFRWLYWSVPINGYKLIPCKNTNKTDISLYTLVINKNEDDSPYRNGLKHCILLLTKEKILGEIGIEVANTLSKFVKEGNGLEIAKLSTEISNISNIKNNLLNQARMELSKITQNIVNLFIQDLILKGNDICYQLSHDEITKNILGTVRNKKTIIMFKNKYDNSTIGIENDKIKDITTFAGNKGKTEIMKYILELKNILYEFLNDIFKIINTDIKQDYINNIKDKYKDSIDFIILWINGLFISLSLSHYPEIYSKFKFIVENTELYNSSTFIHSFVKLLYNSIYEANINENKLINEFNKVNELILNQSNILKINGYKQLKQKLKQIINTETISLIGLKYYIKILKLDNKHDNTHKILLKEIQKI